MSERAISPEASVALPWWQRLHGALMPDYNRKATIYWWLAAVAGAVALGVAAWQVALMERSAWWQIAAGVLIAMTAGFFPVRVKHSKHAFAAGEIFIILLLLMHGPAAATLAAAGEGAVGSWRASKRWTSRIVSPAMAALAMWATGSALHALIDKVAASAGLLLVATMACALGYFMLNTLLVTAVPRLKRNERLRAADLFGVFGGVGIAYVGSAAVASLLYLVYLQSGIGVLGAMVPLLGMMLATLHYFFRQQEASESVRRANAEAQERENELARRHVQELEASERRFHSAFTHASIGMALLDFSGRILQAIAALCALVGRSSQALLNQAFQDAVFEDDRQALGEKLGLVSDREFESFALELRCRHADGHPVWVTAHCSFFSEPGSSAPCLILQLQDVTARRLAEEGLHHLAFHDSLTGLPNRRRFHELLGQAVAQLNASGDAQDAYAVMFLDFDRFKLINDSLGHSAGDAFLVQVSQRIRDSLRPHDVVARLGGDEFGVLVRHVEHERCVVGLAERLMEAMRQPFVVGGTELMTSASIGITFSALGYANPEDVLRDADTAMYKAKAAGKARYALFDTSLHTEVADRLRLEGELRHAIDDGRLSVAYQPVFDLRGGAGQGGTPRLAGFEALVRWQHPVDGSISPGAFLPIAEEAGLMVRLTDFVLHCACRQLHEWQQRGPAWASLAMNVNLSGHDIAHPALVARVMRALVEAEVRPDRLCLELTENILMSRLEGALPALKELRRMGVVLAIDDFGTGYSSLSHLSTLPIDCLKIDRSFVNRLEAGSNEAAVVRSIVLLGSSLGKDVVAEGIETEQQLRQLQDMGCAFGQGYLLSRPLKPADVPRLLQAPETAAADPPSDAGAMPNLSQLSGLRAATGPLTMH
jgi:diguanylate cyclase (GGDEF)-like protein/PAS domain S-box-containing protein